jgi:hypothetical protein
VAGQTGKFCRAPQRNVCCCFQQTIEIHDIPLGMRTSRGKEAQKARQFAAERGRAAGFA